MSHPNRLERRAAPHARNRDLDALHGFVRDVLARVRRIELVLAFLAGSGLLHLAKEFNVL